MILKRCPFCNRIVWFWQSKAYVDAEGKEPCHTVCLLWDALKPDERELETMAVEVDDDTWRKDVEK